MKRELLKYFDFAQRCESIETGVMPAPESEHKVIEKSKNDTLLRVVYAIDSRTGLPTGDLTYFVSDKANPEVKQWILDNLMMDTSSAATPSAPSGFDDDFLLETTRSAGESIKAYADRMNSISDKYKNVILRASAAVQPAKSSVASE